MKKNQSHERLPEFLEEMRKDNPFVTPHNYFKELPDQVMVRIQSEKSRSKASNLHQVLSVFDRIFIPKPAWTLAAVIIVASFFYMNRPRPAAITLIDQEFTSADLAQYVQTHIDDFDESDFYYQGFEGTDLLAETLDPEDIDPIFNDLIDDIDLESLQRIL